MAFNRSVNDLFVNELMFIPVFPNLILGTLRPFFYSLPALGSKNVDCLRVHEDQIGRHCLILSFPISLPVCSPSKLFELIYRKLYCGLEFTGMNDYCIFPLCYLSIVRMTCTRTVLGGGT